MGARAGDALAAVRRRSPELYESVVAGAFGGPLARGELSRAQRELATVAILAALGGAEGPLARHAAAAPRQGVAPCELLALCEHVAVYAGFPRALEALAVVDRALGEAARPVALRRVRLAGHETP
jgi:3-oxoadipate enol-lactonase